MACGSFGLLSFRLCSSYRSLLFRLLCLVYPFPDYSVRLEFRCVRFRLGFCARLAYSWYWSLGTVNPDRGNPRADMFSAPLFHAEALQTSETRGATRGRSSCAHCRACNVAYLCTSFSVHMTHN
jgi:hypothetical protein